MKEQVGHYKIDEKLGAGGMGEVWLAEDTRLDRKVALKFLPHFAAQDETEKARFIQEAKAAARLSHANIAQVYEIGEEDGRLYIVMEYVSGGSLRDRLDEAKGKPIPLKKVLGWVEQTAKGLAEAHQQGITHRDIKPDNLMLTESGQVKITDFGLARLETATRLTASGTALGTVNYMSPELIQGQDVDHRSDLFSLGGTFYELLSAQQVFSGPDANSIYYAILNAPVEPLTRYRKDLPEGLEGIIEKLLDRDPNRRYQSAAEVATDISRLISPVLVTSSFAVWKMTQQKRLQAIPRPVYLTTGIIIGLIVGATLLFSKSGPVDLADYQYTFFEAAPEPESQGVYSHDGRMVVYQKKYADLFWRIMVRRTDGTTPPRPIHTVPYNFPAATLFWSLDDEHIYFVWQGSLERIKLVGAGDSESVLNGVRTATLSTHNELVYINGDGLMIAPHPDSSVASHRPYKPFPADILSPSPGYPPFYLQFSPDGENLGFANFHAETAIDSLYLLSESNQDTDIRPTACGFWIFPWPDGQGKEPYEPFNLNSLSRDDPPPFDWIDNKTVVLSHRTYRPEGGLWFGNIRTGELRRITTSAQFEGFPNVTSDGLSILHDRVLIDFDLVRVPLDGSLPQIELSTAMREYSPSLSLTGDMAYITDRGDYAEIRLRSPDGDDRQLIGQMDFREEDQPVLIWPPAVLSPDGSHVVFAGMRRGSYSSRNTYIAATEGGGINKLISDDRYVARNIQSWSPDGERLVGTIYSPGERGKLSIINKDGDPASIRTLHDYGAIHCRWSPDGKWIAAVFGVIRGVSGVKLYLVTPDGESSKEIRMMWDSENYGFFWSSDSTTIYFYLNNNSPGWHGVWAFDVESATLHRISDILPGIDLANPVGVGFRSSMLPGGDSFLTTARKFSSDLWLLEGFLPPG